MRNEKGQFIKGHKINLGKKNGLGHIFKPTQETRLKMSLAKKGKPAPKGSGFKKGHKLWLGKKWSEESRKKYSEYCKTRKFSLETRKKKSEAMKGEKNHSWKGGVTPTNEIIRHSLEYRLWREAVFKRDNYTCTDCGEREKVSGKLNADHIKQFAYFPELRFAIDNGRTLCVDCHKKTDSYLWKGIKSVKIYGSSK